MIDTPPDVARLHRDLFMQRSGGERLRMAAEMFETAKRLARAGLGDADGRDESPEMRARLFVRIHGPDFDPATRDRIVAWLLRPA
jgi:hypothetical protein